ncbi:hypothetical protein A2V49_02870 [candidate division WWE3 bacterium RBG_19FT_COMBO_34_6]|uniref:Glycosyltransferase RgtA/B/C/D-like domain-containing protein n=1 Tax=candidate division WWE3 bacterium RBG_19FT_COMBO_34_6 TaxID=1802612 RepID=A0A1F4UNT1_UNCKA|nr:MAG: hypothetical protein A2V49_02870 [candidate division WWE3 bacterium RBG_19FT_COMBO_34_6]
MPLKNVANKMRNNIPKIRPLTLLKIVILLFVFFIAAYQRLKLFGDVGKDIYAYEKAIQDLFRGVNPYEWTLSSFSNPDDPGNHGFSYFPLLLYVNGFLYVIALKFNLTFQYLWKVPVILADLGVGFILINHFRLKRFLPLIFSLILWFFNPYFFLKSNYVYFDPLTIFFMLLALYYLEKDDILSGSLYAIAVGFKTFPIILLPLFFLKAKNKLSMFFSMIIVGLAMSLPFITNPTDFLIYLKGTLFVHQERFIQGRPFLFYISYFYKIEFFQIIPLKWYSTLSIFSGWIVSTVLVLKNKLINKYIIASLIFILFYLFTPVLNRTYLLWALPVFVLGADNLSKRYPYYLPLTVFWFFYYWYLIPWKDGFHIWRP